MTQSQREYLTQSNRCELFTYTTERETEMFESIYAEIVPVVDEYMREELQRQGKCVCNTCVNVAYADSRQQWKERYAI